MPDVVVETAPTSSPRAKAWSRSPSSKSSGNNSNCARTNSDRDVCCFAQDSHPGCPLEHRQAGLIERYGRPSEAGPADGSGEGEFGGGPAMGSMRRQRREARPGRQAK